MRFREDALSDIPEPPVVPDELLISDEEPDMPPVDPLVPLPMLLPAVPAPAPMPPLPVDPVRFVVDEEPLIPEEDEPLFAGLLG